LINPFTRRIYKYGSSHDWLKGKRIAALLTFIPHTTFLLQNHSLFQKKLVLLIEAVLRNFISTKGTQQIVIISKLRDTD
jgi:hypothetical protein